MEFPRLCRNSACASSTTVAEPRVGQRRPCCDTTCLREIARRDCAAGCDREHSCGSTKNDEPCTKHYLGVKARYEPTLEAMGCICKALLALGAESCCTRSALSSLRSKRSTTSIRSSTGPSRPSAISGPWTSSEPSKACLSSTTLKKDESLRIYGSDNDAATAKDSHKSQEQIGNKLQSCSKENGGHRQSRTNAKAKDPTVGCCSGETSDRMELPIFQRKEISKSDCCSQNTNETCRGESSIIDKSPEAPKSSCCAKNACSDGAQSTAACEIRAEFSGSEASKKCPDPIDTISAIGLSDCSNGACCKGSRPSAMTAAIPPIVIGSAQYMHHAGHVESALGVPDLQSQGHAHSSSAAVPLFSTIPCATPTGHSPFRMSDHDLERAEVNYEHVVLSVEGMTCTGCEKKLSRSIGSLQLARNITTSLLMAKAQFDIDVTVGAPNIDEVILSIQKMTGFKCSRISKSGQELDIVVRGSVHEFMDQKHPLGVVSMNVVKKRTVRVTYNAAAVGARDLLSGPFASSAELAPPTVRSSVAADRSHFQKMFLMTVFSTILTIPVLVLAWAPLPEHSLLYGSISLALATIIQIVVAGPFYPDTLKALIYARMIEIDLLVVLSTSAAYIYSVIAFAYEARGSPLPTKEFFETSTLLVTLIMAGRTISAFARQKAVETISVESLRIPTALLLSADGNEVEEIDARLLQYGDSFKVLPDMTVVTDGTVETGETEVDESMITGETMPVIKTRGSGVIAGSVNSFGTVVVKLTRLPGENSITVIGNMLDEAKFMKPKIQGIADRVASYFIPAVLALTVLILVVWIIVGKFVRHQSSADAAIKAMTYAISALIVSCPCAIGLAVPMVVVMAGGVAAKHGVIVKSASAIEIARKVTHIVFDKTGTLTQGNFSVVSEVYLAGPEDLSCSLALGLMSNSKHPVSSAVAAHLKDKGVKAAKIESVVSLVGKGVEGEWDQSIVRAGSPRWLDLERLPSVRYLFSTGLTVICLSLGEKPLLVFGLEDLLRSDAIEVVAKLQQRNISVSIISGDNSAAVHSLARKLGVHDNYVRAQCSPADKQQYVQNLLSSTKNTILFCGDGTNDAVALAQASVGVHMSEGTDIASNAADAVLLRPSLSGILVLVDLSKAFYRRVCFNFIWAFVYNMIAILLAAGALVYARIPPQYAGLGELVSVLPVVAIAMQLRWVNFK